MPVRMRIMRVACVCACIPVCVRACVLTCACVSVCARAQERAGEWVPFPMDHALATGAICPFCLDPRRLPSAQQTLQVRKNTVAVVYMTDEGTCWLMADGARFALPMPMLGSHCGHPTGAMPIRPIRSYSNAAERLRLTFPPHHLRLPAPMQPMLGSAGIADRPAHLRCTTPHRGFVIAQTGRDLGSC